MFNILNYSFFFQNAKKKKIYKTLYQNLLIGKHIDAIRHNSSLMCDTSGFASFGFIR